MTISSDSTTQDCSRFSEFDIDYVNEPHIQAFANALSFDDSGANDLSGANSPSSPGTPRIRKVAALSDFAPVNLKVKRRRRGEHHNDKRSEWLFHILRWPLLSLISLFILAEFGFYIFVRQLVNTKEWLMAWRGRKGVLRKRLRAAKSYQEWKDAAETLDDYLHFDQWKKLDEDPYYDWKLVRKVKKSLAGLRKSGDVRGVLGVLETCMRTNFAGTESSRLYSETFLGTKDLIEAYIDEQEKALEFIRESKELSNEEKKRFFKTANTNVGTSALCLSGGASFGYYHCGVVKALLDAKLLPRVITGTSAGGLIAALICTRTEEELKNIIIPALANKITASEEPFRVWFKRFLRTGARFDSVLWARKCSFFTRGSMTFKEAYLRTGRILNISVIPADRHSPTKLLNYLTAPDTIIWSALLASAAVPGILNPVVLMSKLKDGTVVPWNWGSKFKDGSLRVDIPIQALNLYFNVTQPVVSQVNPHIHLFFFAPRGSAGKPVAHRKGKGWRGNFLLSAAEQWLKHELTKNFKVIRDLELLPQLLGQDWSSVFLQRFDGAITIWPRTRVWDWFRLLADPDPQELERMIRGGQIATWPKLHMIENRFRLEKQIFLGRQAVRRSLSKNRHQPAPLQTEGLASGSHLTPISNVPTGSDRPMSVDTDAEEAFKSGSRIFFKRGRGTPTPNTDTSGAVPQKKSHHDTFKSRSLRRKWSTALLQEHVPEPNTLPAPTTPQRTTGIPTNSFFSRLRTKSPSLALPFSSLRSNAKDPAEKHAWSSESSSEEDLFMDERRHIRNPSILNFKLVADQETPSDQEYL